MLDMPDLSALIADSCSLACRNTLQEVFLHLESRSFKFTEIVTALVDISDDRGYRDFARALEDAALKLPRESKGNSDEINSL